MSLSETKLLKPFPHSICWWERKRSWLRGRRSTSTAAPHSALPLWPNSMSFLSVTPLHRGSGGWGHRSSLPGNTEGLWTPKYLTGLGPPEDGKGALRLPKRAWTTRKGGYCLCLLVLLGAHLTWCRLRLACSAAVSFSSCFTRILTTSCRNFSLASLVSRPPSRACRRCSSSASSPLGASAWAAASGATTGGACMPGELRSLAELDEVKDGEDSEDREEVTEETEKPEH